MFRTILTVVLVLLSVSITNSSYINESKKSDENFKTLFAAENAVSFTEIVSSLPTPTEFPEKLVKEETEEKVSSFNIRSEKEVGDLPEKAVENSPALIPCTETEANCNQVLGTNDGEPTPTPTRIPTPTSASSPSPTPTIDPEPIPDPIPYPSCPPPPPCNRYSESKIGPDMPCPVYSDTLREMPCYYLDNLN